MKPGGLILLGLVVGAGVLVLASSSHTAPTRPSGPTGGTGGTGATGTPRPTQDRPFAATLSPTDIAQVTRVGQQQLQDLGYSITRVDGISGPETRAAIQAFIGDHPAEANAARSTYPNYTDGRQVAYLIDDVYRTHFGLPAASV